MFFETIPYIIVFIVIGSYAINKNTKSTNDLVFFVLFVFSALRYDVGYDYLMYEKVILTGSEHEVERFELGEKILLLISRETFIQLFFIINSFITVYFTKFAIDRLSPDKTVSALAYFCFPNMFMYSLGVVRFCSALSIVFYASTFLKDKKYIPYLIFQCIALLFHNAAIVGILFIPLYLIKIPYMVNIGLLFFGFFGGEYVFGQIMAGLFPDNVYTGELLNYANREAGSGMSKIPYLFLGFDLLLLFGCRNLLNKVKDFNQMVSIFNVGVSLMFLFSFQNTLSIRLSLPFLAYSIIIIAYIVKNKNKAVFTYKSKLIMFETFCFITLIYTITIYNESLGKSQYLPYKLFF